MMQAKAEFERIAQEVNSRFFRKQDIGCVDISDDEILDRASEMAKHGYSFDSVSIDALKAYLEGYGVLISGDVGTGKTSFFKAIGKIRVVTMVDLYANPLDEIVEIVDRMNDEEIVVDDIGTEPVYSNYGCKMDILPWLIERRSKSEMRTHYTTNLNGDALTKRYGARVFDRMYETCKMFKFAGTSRRELKANRRIVEDSRRSAKDWTLCEERCANCANGKCAKGIRIPPELERRPPEECKGFKPR